MRDSTGLYTYTFDAVHHELSIADGSRVVTFAYDAAQQRIGKQQTPGGRTTYAYDQAGRLASEIDAGNRRTTFAYDAADRKTLVTQPDGSRASSTFNAADQLSSLFNFKGDGTVESSATYRLDGTGNRLGVTDAAGQKTSWTFDRTYQLINENRSGTGGFNTSFTFDAVGNRLVKNASGALTTSAFDAANQLVTSVDASGTTTYTFDAAGNQQIEQAPSGTTTNAWYYENQMTLVQMPNGLRETMAYNAEFRRTRRRS